MAVSHSLPLGLVPATCLLLALTAGPATAQREAGFAIDGFRIELGTALPQHAEPAPLVGATLHVGTFGFPWIDASVGARWWTSDIDRSSLDGSEEGTLGDLGIRAGLSTHMSPIRGARPYLTVGLAGHRISADIPGDRSLEDALEGVRLGADIGIGLASTRDGIGWRAEARRDFVEDAGHWGLVVGFGWWPTTRAKRPDPTASSPTPASATVIHAPAHPTPGPAMDGQLRRELDRLQRQNERLAARLDSLAAVREAAPTTPPVTEATAEPSPPMAPVPRELGETVRQMARLGGESEVVRTNDGFILRLFGEALFASGSATVQPAAHEELRRLALVLLRHPDVLARVEGHSDSQGPDGFNLQLSQRRAEAVAAELLAVGIDPSRVSALGIGEDRPVASNDDPAGRARNRRVEIHLTEPLRGGQR